MVATRRRIRTLILLALVAFAAHALALVGVLPGSLPSTGDTLGLLAPWHEFIRHTFAQGGEIPLWDPHLYCGTPFIGNGQSGLLYPPNLIYLLLPENGALWLFAFGHSFFLMAGSYFLARTLGMKRRAAFLVAVLFGLGNANPGHQFGGHLTFLPVRSYWPWEAAFLIRLLRGQGWTNAVWLAACVGVGLMAGAPQMWFFGLLFCAGIFLFWLGQCVVASRQGSPLKWKKAVLPLFLTALLVALWCTPIILPLMEMRGWSSHGDSLSFREVTSLSATPRSLFRLLFNSYFGGNSFYMWSLPFNPSEDAASLGLAALVLALVAPFCSRKSRVVWALLGFCGAMILLALGNSTPLYQLLYDHSSFFKSTRVPARWLELWAFGASLLAGFCVDGALREPAHTRQLLKVFAAAFGGSLVLGGMTLVLHAPWETGGHIIIHALALPATKIPEIAQNLQTDALISCLLSGTCVGLIAWFLRRGFTRSASLILFLSLVCFEPLCNFWLSVKISPAENVAASHIPPKLLAHYQAGQRWTIQTYFDQLNAPLFAGIDALNGYEPFGSAPFFTYARAAVPDQLRSGTPFLADFQPNKMVPLWRVAGVTHILWKARKPGDDAHGFPGRTIGQEGEWNLVEIQDGLQPWPRTYLTRDVKRVGDTERYPLLKKLALQNFPAAYPVVAGPEFPALKAGSGTLKLYPRVTSPDVLEWDVSTGADAVFVHQSALAPGWTAFVDGKKTPLYPVNGFFCGVPVPQGAQKVALVYNTESLRFSFFLALCALGLASSTLMVARRQRTEGGAS